MTITTATFEQVKTLAAAWQDTIALSQDKAEKKFHALMKRMLKDPRNKLFLIELLDQSFRAKQPQRVAAQLEYLFDKYGKTDMFSPFESMLVWLFRHAGIYVPEVSVPLFIKYLRNDVSNVVIQGEASPLQAHLKLRRAEGTRVNINIIGEAVLGEEEAKQRIEKYIQALKNPDIDYISVKISTLFSQIIPLAHDQTVAQISKRLEAIYRAAIQHTYVDHEGVAHPKFVNLDMEEYHDVRLTLDVFKYTLSQDAFLTLHAGIVLQAYVPDTFEQVKALAAWAHARVQKGGAPIKIRLVKGANQEMELTEASLRGWPCVTYETKAQTDANFKRILEFLLRSDVAPFVHTGLASHNLFDHALGMLLSRERRVQAFYTAEMLEGMSESAYRLLKKEGLQVILYAPTATAQTFTNAIAYLVRRFDENTAAQNYLRHSFGLKTGTPAWDGLVATFDEAIQQLSSIKDTPNRSQDRTRERFDPVQNLQEYVFENEPDTDFALVSNQQWAHAIRDTWQHIGKKGGFHAYPVIAGQTRKHGETITVMDKSQYHEGAKVGSYTTAIREDLLEAVETAQADVDHWRDLDVLRRKEILFKVALEFKKERGNLIGIAAAEVGKVFSETDVEISEAIDFLHFYAQTAQEVAALDGIQTQGKGVGLVISPWNFPIAIPVGGIAAALSAGNTVLLKPASHAVLCAQALCECFWRAGVSKHTLQFVPCSGALAGRVLIPHEGIDFVIFTGGEETAYEMLKTRPHLHLSAETGGKNATIVTALADKDQAVKNVVASAFNNSGQKCSATSLLVLEKELYEDEDFKRMLIDAAASIEVGSVWDFKNRIGALVAQPSGKLKEALAVLDEGESWAIPPSYADGENPYMLKPSIRWGTKEDDFCHKNELFGPVLSVVCAKDLQEAIDIVNATGYGLTSGLESLDEREQEFWKEHIIAGNLYINRMTTGAIVRRQPFGGMRKSAIGSGKKAGGYNYVTQFMHLLHTPKGNEPQAVHPFMAKIHALKHAAHDYEEALVHVMATAGHFAYWLEKEFLPTHDYSHIRGEDNIIRYVPFKRVLLRLDEQSSFYEMLCSIAAVKLSGAALDVSLPSTSKSACLSWLKEHHEQLLDSSDSFAIEEERALMPKMRQAGRIRFLSAWAVSPSLYEAAANEALYIARDPFVSHPRVELMHFFLEQSISHSYHRYGNLGSRGIEDTHHNT